MHWADVIAKELAPRSDAHFVATGITPSGHIHVGNMREILTGDTVVRALKHFDDSIDITLYYIGDTIDPLRKVYPNHSTTIPFCKVAGSHSNTATNNQDVFTFVYMA